LFVLRSCARFSPSIVIEENSIGPPYVIASASPGKVTILLNKGLDLLAERHISFESVQ
jgi:hypothetical protein